MPQEVFEKVPVLTQHTKNENIAISVLTQREQIHNKEYTLADIYTNKSFTNLIQEIPNNFNNVEFLEGELLIFLNLENIDVEVDINGDLIVKNSENYILNDMGELLFVK